MIKLTNAVCSWKRNYAIIVTPSFGVFKLRLTYICYGNENILNLGIRPHTIVFMLLQPKQTFLQLIIEVITKCSEVSLNNTFFKYQLSSLRRVQCMLLLKVKAAR